MPKKRSNETIEEEPAKPLEAKVEALGASDTTTTSLDELVTLQYSLHNRIPRRTADFTLDTQEQPEGSVVWCPSGHPLHTEPVILRGIGWRRPR